MAWIDEHAAQPVLHVGTFALDGTVRDVALPGWTPVGDEAFQLVRRGSTVYLAILRAAELDVLTTCP